MRLAPALRALALAALLAAPALAQAPAVPAPAPAPAPAAAPEPIEPVPLPRVVEQGEEAQRNARKLGELSAPVPEIEEIEASLPQKSALLRERAKRAQSIAKDPASLVALDDELRAWEIAREQLSGALTLLTGRLTDLESALDELSRQREIWRATEQAALQAKTPDTVVSRIRDVSDSLRDTKRSVEKRRDELLTLQAQVAEQEKRARAALDELSDARQSFRSLLFLRDHPPLWSAAFAEDAEVGSHIAEAFAARQRAAHHFWEARKERLAAQLLLFVVVLAVAFALRRRAAAWRAADPRLEASGVVFERPISAALLIVVSLTPVFNPRAPRLVDAITMALLIVPILRLLPRLLEPALVPAVYALSVFALVDRLRDVLSRSELFERCLLLLETVAALAFLYWMLRPARLAALPKGAHLPRWLGRTLRLGFVLLALSALLNVAGWVHLGRILSDGVIVSSYVAIILYGGVRVLRTAARGMLRSDAAQGFAFVRRRGPLLQLWTGRAIDTAAFAVWGWLALVAFSLDDWARSALATLFDAKAQFGAVGISLGDVLAFVLTLAGAFVLSRVLRALLEDDVVPRLHANRGVGYALTTTVHYAVLLIGFLLAISAAGVDLNKVSLLAGAFGVGIGFGLQNVVNNFVSGLILLYERPVQLGDMVEVGGTTGEVVRIGIRSSAIRTFQGAEVIVPNSALISDRVVNWTFSDRRRRMEIKVGVAYGTPPEQVLELLESVARGHADVLDDPRPQALFMGFGQSSLDFELRAWTALFDNYVVTQSQLSVAVAHALAEAGIEIPFPQRDLHLRSADAEAVRSLRGPER